MSETQNETMPNATQSSQTAQTAQVEEPLYGGYTRFELELEVS